MDGRNLDTVTADQPETTPDLVGRTSAALVGLGVPRPQRLEALHLLAVLDASVGLDGRVRRPLDDLADEFELPIADVVRSLDHLERAGAIERDGAGVTLVDRHDDGIGGLHLADFLDDVRASLEDRPARRLAVWPVRVGAGMLAAAAAAAVLLLAPTQPATFQPTAAGDPTTTPAAATQHDAAVSTAEETDATAPAPPAGTAAVSEPPGELAAASCPTGAPAIRAVGTSIELTNPTDAAIVVTAITVAGTPVAIDPLTVAAGETVVHDLAAPPGIGADPTIDSWHRAAGAADPGCS